MRQDSFVLLTAFLYTLMAPGFSFSQANYQFEEANFYVTGKSTLTDWKAEASAVIGCPAELTFNSENGTIEHFSFQVVTKSFDGGRGSSMNEKIYKALRSSEFPYIEFNQTAPASNIATEDGIGSDFESNGKLSIAGTSRDVRVFFKGIRDESSFIFRGTHPLKLSDFNIEPPSAMFGQIQTRDDIVVHFEIKYKMIP